MNIMNIRNIPKPILITIAVVAALILIAAVWFFFFRKPAVYPEPVEGPSPFITIQTAQDLAFVEARAWHDDARLVKIFPEDGATNAEGQSRSLRAWFSSASAGVDAGFEVVIRDRNIVSAQEIFLSHKGGNQPSGGLMGQEDALIYMRSLSDYQDAQVTYMDLYFVPSTGQWMWGLKTSKGELSVEAGRL